MFDSLFSFLDNAVGALAKRVLSALGIGWISFTGISGLIDYFKQAFLGAWGGIPGDILNVLSLGGFTTAVSIIFGAYMYRAAMSSFSWLGKVIL